MVWDLCQAVKPPSYVPTANVTSLSTTLSVRASPLRRERSAEQMHVVMKISDAAPTENAVMTFQWKLALERTSVDFADASATLKTT